MISLKMSFNIKNTLSVLAAAGLLPLAQAEVPTIEGFTLTWSDDFVGTANSLPNTADWQVLTGTSYPGGAANWGTNEIETVRSPHVPRTPYQYLGLADNESSTQFTSSTENLALTGNNTLGITARKDAAGAWTSARIETVRSDFGAAAGGKMRIQGSLSLPPLGENGVGYWPAFWTLGSNFRGNVT